MKMKKHHYKLNYEPQEINTCLPHLQNGGEWLLEHSKSRMKMYLGWLKELGMEDADAQCMMSDLYWDCFNELEASNKTR